MEEPHLLPAQKIVRKPSDLLKERQTLLRRIEGAKIPSIDALKRHAERYGVDGVMETAAELGYNIDSCLRLQEFCDRVDGGTFKRRGKALASPEVRVRLLLGIEDNEA